MTNAQEKLLSTLGEPLMYALLNRGQQKKFNRIHNFLDKPNLEVTWTIIELVMQERKCSLNNALAECARKAKSMSIGRRLKFVKTMLSE